MTASTQDYCKLAEKRIKEIFPSDSFDVLVKAGHWGDSFSIAVGRKDDRKSRMAYILTGGVDTPDWESNNDDATGFYNADNRIGFLDTVNTSLEAEDKINELIHELVEKLK